MSHKCKHPGCGFSLPDNYSDPLCPWHTEASDDLTKAAVAVGMLAIYMGAVHAYDKLRDVFKRRKAEAKKKALSAKDDGPEAKK